MTTWAQVRDRIIARDPRGLADLVITLPDAERAEAARRLPELHKDLRAAAGRRAGERWSSGQDEGEGDGEWDRESDGEWEGDGRGPWDGAGDCLL
ncbi:hypothetical protein [Nonomuraea zeae]|uniref:Uncharacterized protein n=1 Tax=Nonomuraea zeae TaxID=1642303 RepID=A0A5S4EY47_9ACTN|nr:hypothetical protein [Nonomuraea zeae]TMR08598.1 hypothetical protein ETD85_62130 [Nonomuraea zeae]